MIGLREAFFLEEGLGALVVCRGVETEGESTVRGTGQEACPTFFLLMSSGARLVNKALFVEIE